MSDDSDSTNKTEKRRKRPLKAAGSMDSSDSGSPLVVTKRSRKQLAVENESDASTSNSSSNSSPLAPRLTRRRRVPVVASDDESSTSEDEEIIAIRPSIRRTILPNLSDYESGTSNPGDDGSSSDSDGSLSEGESSQNQHPAAENKVDEGASGSSSDSDGQSERCPICLIKFVSQEVGTPETCDHFFCAPCIQEWSKNVNTCPVDRQPYKLILIRGKLGGKVIRQIPVQEQSSDQEIQEDTTCCEICSLSDREETLLLCDGCDNGYHMECLNPPLEYVPIEEWYCPECAPQHRRGRNQGRSHRGQRAGNDEDGEEEDGDDDIIPLSRFRLVPRTRQAERVRRNVRRNNSGPQQAEAPQPSTSGIESGGDRVRAPVRARATPRARSNRRRTTTQSRRTGVRIKRIVTDDGVIEVILKIKKKKGKKRKKRRKGRKITVSSPKTVKGRLAARLGMCKPRIARQTIPETVNRQEITSAPIIHQRHQAGLPTLDLFGRRDQLDYFSGSESEDNAGSMEGGVGVLSRIRSAHPSNRLISRKKAASVLSATTPRKPIKIAKLATPAGSNLLDSILDSQTLWHSKKTEIKSNSDGTLKVIPKGGTLKQDNKVDVKKTTAPVKESPMLPGGRPNSGTFRPENSSQGGNSQSENKNYSERSEENSYQSSAPAGSGFLRSEGPMGTGPMPLRGVAPIRFRMNIPPRRPNIHSYPSDNIPPPPPLRLRSPMSEMSFPSTNSPEASPEREEEDVDIYSDIEQESNTAHETEERTFGALEPPPEPPFLMTMEPPPEPPALLMNLNDDASDDEPSGLIIDDPPAGDVYDPCAVNSDESSTGDAPLSKPPELPMGLKHPELVANYSSDSCPTQESSSYNPELPTYSSTRIIGPLPRPASHHSSEAEEDDEECPNFSLYSATSMKIAHREFDLDIPIPPPIQKESKEDSMDIPLPEENLHAPDDKEGNEDIPLQQDDKTTPSLDCKGSDGVTSPYKEDTRDSDKGTEDNIDTNKASVLEEIEVKNVEENDDDDDEDNDEDDDDDDDDEDDDTDEDSEDIENKDEEHNDADDDKSANKSENESVHGDNEKIIKVKSLKNKDSEAGEDECSTQGDVLDLAIESEPNLENNIPHDDSEEHSEMALAKSPARLEESDDKIGDGGDKSDGLVDITDEEMSVYDGHDNTDLERISEQIRESIQNEKLLAKSLNSDDDNSLVGGATSAVSAASLNNSDNVLTSTLPGLEGLETETISESEDVNFDELPLENHDQPEAVVNEDDLNSSRRKKKKKSRKISQNEETLTKGNNEPLEFEEGEIIEEKPKKDKKLKPKPEAEVEVDENIDSNKPKQPIVEKEKDNTEKKTKKKKDKSSGNKEKTDKNKEREPKEKTLKPGEADENISWKKLSKSTKERNYRDGKEKDEKNKEKDKEKDRENKEESSKKKNREKRKELERYDVRRLISEKPKRPKKDEFGRDISPSSSSLSPYRPPRYRSPLRTRNRSRTRSRSLKSRSRSRGRRRRSRSRDRVRSRDRFKRSRSRDKSRRSRSQNRISSRSRDRRRSPEKPNKAKTGHRSLSRGRRKSRSRSHHSYHSKKNRSTYSKSWTPSWSRSSMSRSRSPRRRRKSKSITRSRSRSWSREKIPSMRGVRRREPPKNLTVIVSNKEAMKKKEKKKLSKKKDDRRKKRRGQSPAPSKEVFTSGDNILVSVNFKNANKNPEIIPATTPLLRESSKRKREDAVDGSGKKKKSNNSSKKTPGKKSNRLAKINEAAKNAKPVAIIDLDVSPFRAQTPPPVDVIILSDSGDEGDKQHHSEMQDENIRMGHSGINQSMLSLSSIEHGQKNSVSQPESPVSSFMHNSSGPKTPPEPHIKFSISTKQSQMRMLSNPLMEAEEEMQDENIENEVNEIMHKGPNTPPEPPPEMTTPASPPTTPYDPFDPTKSRSPSPQPRSDTGSQLNTSREDKLENVQSADDDHPSLNEPRTLTPPNEIEETKKTPEPPKVHSTPKHDTNAEISPKVSPPTGSAEPKLAEDSIMQPIKKLLADANKLNVTVHKSPEKLITVVISQQTKNQNQTPKQPALPLKIITPNKQLTPKSNSKHQLFSANLVKQVPILGTLLPGPPVYTPSSVLNNSKLSNRSQQNGGDTFEDMDIDPSSPYSPGSSEGDDLFEPPILSPPRSSSKPSTNKSKPPSGNKFDALFGSSPAKNRHGRYSKSARKTAKPKSKGSKKEEVKVKLDEDQLKILDELPSSAVEMQFLKKLNRQERVVEEVKLVLKPHYAKKHVNKEEYKEILRRSVPKICHNKSGEINPIKIQHLVEAYVKKFRYAKKKAAGAIPVPAAQNKPKPQKTLWS